MTTVVGPSNRTTMITANPRHTVFFDGSCPVCRREIALYQTLRGADAMRWVDASRCAQSQLGAGLERTAALRRFHLRRNDGTLVSGAAAFVEIWKQLPAFAGLARFGSRRCGLALLDFAYDCFLLVRRLWRAPAVTACSNDTKKRSL